MIIHFIFKNMKKVYSILIFNILIYTVFSQTYIEQKDISKSDIHKFALIIGNENYYNRIYHNAIDDSKLVAKSLTKLGFTVKLLNDANYEVLTKEITNTYEVLSNDSNVFFILYISGYGVQVNGINYLIPVDQDVKSENDLLNKTLSINTILDEMNKYNNYINFIILDIPRANPLKDYRKYYDEEFVLPKETFIIYSFCPGADSEYLIGSKKFSFGFEFCKAINRKGLTIEEIDTSLRNGVRESTNKFRSTCSTSNLSIEYYINPK